MRIAAEVINIFSEYRVRFYFRDNFLQRKTVKRLAVLGLSFTVICDTEFSIFRLLVPEETWLHSAMKRATVCVVRNETFSPIYYYSKFLILCCTSCGSVADSERGSKFICKVDF